MAETTAAPAASAPVKDGDPKQVKRTTLFVQGLPEETDKAMLQQMFGDVGPLRRVTLVTEKGERKSCKGYAFVTFALEDDAKKALETLHGAKIIGQKMNIDFAKPRQREGGRKEVKEKKRAPAADGDTASAPTSVAPAASTTATTTAAAVAKPPTVPKPKAPLGDKRKFEKPKKVKAEDTASKRWRLIVRNLSFKATKEEVQKAFQQCGDVVEVLIPQKKDKSGPSGFAFVQLGSKAAGEKAIRLLNGSTAVAGGRPIAVDWALDKKHYLEHLNKKEDTAEQKKTKVKKEEESDESDSSSSSSSSSSAEDKKKKKKVKKEKSDPVEVSSDSDSEEPKRKKKQKTTSSESVKDGAIVIKMEFPDPDDTKPKKEKVKKEAKDEKSSSSSSSASEDESEEEKQETKEGNEDYLSFEKQSDSVDEAEKMKKEADDLKDVKVKTDKIHKQKKVPGVDVVEGRTLFIRNLPFIITEEELMDRFSQYGAIKYCLLVKRSDTGTPKGSAFVQFESKEGADKCLQEAYPKEKSAAATAKSSAIAAKIAQRKGSTASLQLTELLSEIRVHGRQLIISPAVNRSEAAELSAKQKDRKIDKRNLYLAAEGAIDPNSVAAKTMSKADLEKRARGDEEKKKKLTSPNFFVSRTRLSVRNLPASVDDAQLRELFFEAAKSVPGKNRPRIVQAKLQKDPERKNKSKGYGFIEFEEHEHALAALRKINNNPDYFGEERRPIVEFAIENVLTLHKRELRNSMMERKRSGADRQQVEGGAESTNGNARQPRGEKRSRKQEEEAGEEQEGKNAKKQKKKQHNPKQEEAEGGRSVWAKPQPAPKKPKSFSAPSEKPIKKQQKKRGVGEDAEIAAALRTSTATNKKLAAAKEKKTTTKKVRSHSQQKRRESKDEDRFQSLVENYKQSLSSNKVATSGWFDLAGKQ